MSYVSDVEQSSVLNSAGHEVDGATSAAHLFGGALPLIARAGRRRSRTQSFSHLSPRYPFTSHSISFLGGRSQSVLVSVRVRGWHASRSSVRRAANGSQLASTVQTESRQFFGNGHTIINAQALAQLARRWRSCYLPSSSASAYSAESMGFLKCKPLAFAKQLAYKLVLCRICVAVQSVHACPYAKSASCDLNSSPPAGNVAL